LFVKNNRIVYTLPGPIYQTEVVTCSSALFAVFTLICSGYVALRIIRLPAEAYVVVMVWEAFPPMLVGRSSFSGFEAALKAGHAFRPRSREVGVSIFM